MVRTHANFFSFTLLRAKLVISNLNINDGLVSVFARTARTEISIKIKTEFRYYLYSLHRYRPFSKWSTCPFSLHSISNCFHSRKYFNSNHSSETISAYIPLDESLRLISRIGLRYLDNRITVRTVEYLSRPFVISI